MSESYRTEKKISQLFAVLLNRKNENNEVSIFNEEIVTLLENGGNVEIDVCLGSKEKGVRKIIVRGEEAGMFFGQTGEIFIRRKIENPGIAQMVTMRLDREWIEGVRLTAKENKDQKGGYYCESGILTNTEDEI